MRQGGESQIERLMEMKKGGKKEGEEGQIEAAEGW